MTSLLVHKLAFIKMHRRLKIKYGRKIPAYTKLVVAKFVCVFLIDKLIIENKLFRSRDKIIQNDLLDYHEDGLRPDWPFRISKNYDVYDLRPYVSKPKIIARSVSPGERGTPVVLSPMLQELADLSFSEYQINIVASDKVAPNRSLPDLREPMCLDIKYPSLLPTATVIMVIHNEAMSVLLRAIWSVLNRSPDDLLEELILVDDLSDKSHLKESFDEYMAEHFPSKVKLIRNEKREGLIRARVIGAKQGQVIIFLDGNTESNDGWLEPLLSRIASDRSVIAIPHVDNINFTNMAYEEFDEGLMYGVGWNMYYKTFPIPEREFIRNRGDITAPYRTPAMIGCAIAIDREFFFEIGTFDTKMDIWGGENTELSLRVWQCGGAMEIVPCSRVEHYFRTLPYTFNNADKTEVKIRNNIRITEVWMDDYKPYFRVILSPHQQKIKPGDVSERIALRNRLKCKGFHWYLRNVFPESVMNAGFNVVGQIQQVGTKYCLDKMGRSLNRQIGIHGCHGNGYSQGFAYQKNHQIVFHHSDCLTLAKEEEIDENAETKNDPNVVTRNMNTTNHAVFLNCNATSGEKWNYDEAKNQIVHLQTGLCLATDTWDAVVSACNSNDTRQKWIFTTFEDYKRKLMLSADKPVDPSNV